jgi:23S rRNA (uracil1939-C5)-methyltransferase
LIVKPLLPAYGGYTVARDDKIILVKGAIPGEVVEVTVQEKKRDYTLAAVSQIVEPSEYRVEPKCPVFGVCGGCHLQYVSYERQLSMKEEVLVDSLTRLGGIEVELGPSLSDAQWNYRHRAQFKVSRQGNIGFFRESSRDIVEFEACPLMKGEINGLLRTVKEKALAQGLKEMHFSVGDAVAVLLKYNGEYACDHERFRQAGMASIACNDDLTEGSGYIAFDLLGLKYTVSPWTFFQAHWSLNTKVAELITQAAEPLKGQIVLDLYAGAGNFSLPLAGQAQEILLVEENPHAIEDGTRNLKMNRLKNCRFIKSSAEKFKMQKKVDLLILDPPRPGLTVEVAKKVIEHAPARIVYISCNPATLARDLKKLKEKYEITSVRMIDFFPNTFHIEAVVFLQIR